MVTLLPFISSRPLITSFYSVHGQVPLAIAEYFFALLNLGLPPADAGDLGAAVIGPDLCVDYSVSVLYVSSRL